MVIFFNSFGRFGFSNFFLLASNLVEKNKKKIKIKRGQVAHIILALCWLIIVISFVGSLFLVIDSIFLFLLTFEVFSKTHALFSS